MFTKTFWKETLERSVKSGAQAAILAFGVGVTNVLSVDALKVVGAAGAGFVLSVLTSVASAKTGSPDTPSLLKDKS